MPLPLIPGVVRATAGGTIAGGGRWNNTFHFRRSDLADPSDAQINEIPVALAAFYGTTLIVWWPAATTLEQVDVTPLDGTSGAHSYALNLAGTDSRAAMPAEVAECLTIRTAGRGRRARGRVFLPCMTNGAYDALGHIEAVHLAALVADANTLSAALGVLGWQWGVASYGQSVQLDHTVRPPRRVVTTWAPFFTPATGFTMDPLPDVQRGRKR